ncbi:MAG: hypothetical protein AB1715_05015, partial [Acidobacteriota bacterium]
RTGSRFFQGPIRKMGLVSVKKALFNLIKKEKPYYQIHTHDRYLPRFTPEEMQKAYLQIARLLLQNLNIQGLYRISWLLDPQLEKISPHLAHLRKIPEQNGAVFFRLGTFPMDRERAVRMSPLRKKLYEEGLYVPISYAYVWPREKIIQWSKNHPGWIHGSDIAPDFGKIPAIRYK